MRYTAEQIELLDAVGKALTCQLIDFTAATELRDQIRAGRPNEAKTTLTEIADTYLQILSSLSLVLSKCA